MSILLPKSTAANKVITNNSKAEANVFNIEFKLFKKKEATKPESALFRMSVTTSGLASRLITMIESGKWFVVILSLVDEWPLPMSMNAGLKKNMTILQIIELKYMNMFCNITSALRAVEESFKRYSL